MKTFSIIEAVGEPFRQVGRRPLATIVWGLVLIAPSLLVLAAMIPLLGGMMASGGFDPASLESDEALFGGDMAAMMQFQLWSNLANLVQMFGVLFVTTAVIRAVYAGRGGDRFFFLRFSLVELQVAVIGIAVFVGFCLTAVVAVLLVVAVGVGLWQASEAASIIVSIVLGTATLLGLMLLWGRLALLAPASVHYKTFAFEEGWKLGRGKTWALLGLAIVLILITLMLGIVLVTVMLIVFLAVGGGVQATDPAAVEAWLRGLSQQPGLLIGLAVLLALPMAWLQGFSQVLYTAPYAHVVRALVGPSATEDTAAEFH